MYHLIGQIKILSNDKLWGIKGSPLVFYQSAAPRIENTYSAEAIHYCHFRIEGTPYLSRPINKCSQSSPGSFNEKYFAAIFEVEGPVNEWTNYGRMNAQTNKGANKWKGSDPYQCGEVQHDPWIKKSCTSKIAQGMSRSLWHTGGHCHNKSITKTQSTKLVHMYKSRVQNGVLAGGASRSGSVARPYRKHHRHRRRRCVNIIDMISTTTDQCTFSGIAWPLHLRPMLLDHPRHVGYLSKLKCQSLRALCESCVVHAGARYTNSLKSIVPAHRKIRHNDSLVLHKRTVRRHELHIHSMPMDVNPLAAPFACLFSMRPTVQRAYVSLPAPLRIFKQKYQCCIWAPSGSSHSNRIELFCTFPSPCVHFGIPTHGLGVQITHPEHQHYRVGATTFGHFAISWRVYSMWQIDLQCGGTLRKNTTRSRHVFTHATTMLIGNVRLVLARKISTNLHILY